MPRYRRTTVTAAAVFALLCAGACSGRNTDAAASKPSGKTTITFWHGWSAEHEVKAIEDAVAAFERKYPHIEVKVVGEKDETEVRKALKQGSSGPVPDVASLSTTETLGLFCSFQVFTDLGPYLEKSKINPDLIMPRPVLERTRFEGTQCALPLLADSYGLYYNKDAFRRAGIKAPPKTMTEFSEVAEKLTVHQGDSYRQVGFMPLFQHYENSASRLASPWSPTYLDLTGKSNVAGDPAFPEMLRWQKNLVDRLGGYQKLERYRTTFGDEWGDANAFHTGQVAMALDGEWRLAMLKRDRKVGFEVGVAPLPVPDDQLNSYGKGPVAGTIITIPTASKKKDAAWQLVKYLTTDTEAVVDFANAIYNVPSTLAALRSPDLVDDKRFRVFVDIAQHPDSQATPASIDGDGYLWKLHEFALSYQSGKATDLERGLKDVDRKVNKQLDMVQDHLY